mmetsp:Transcript_8253/g.19408  ORF Transcript_8253/g.19408 Transcript_8253/m.19408 type:complete len:233 (+) Transcript_8253:100-798(+)
MPTRVRCYGGPHVADHNTLDAVRCLGLGLLAHRRAERRVLDEGGPQLVLIDLTAVVEVDLGEDLGHEGLLPIIREQQGLELADLDVAAVVRVDQGEDLVGDGKDLSLARAIVHGRPHATLHHLEGLDECRELDEGCAQLVGIDVAALVHIDAGEDLVHELLGVVAPVQVLPQLLVVDGAVVVHVEHLECRVGVCVDHLDRPLVRVAAEALDLHAERGRATRHGHRRHRIPGL